VAGLLQDGPRVIGPLGADGLRHAIQSNQRIRGKTRIRLIWRHPPGGPAGSGGLPGGSQSANIRS
jgi:hypothetical protein